MAKQTTLTASLIPTDSPVTINASQQIARFDLGKTSGSFAIQVDTAANTGSTDLVLEVSLDGQSYTEVSRETVDTAENTAIFDFPNGSGAAFARVFAEVSSGQLDLTKILFAGKALRS